MESLKILESLDASPLHNVVLEELNPPFIQQPGQSSNAPSLENIYSLVRENNVRLENMNARLENMERHLLFLQKQQAQTSQIVTNLLNVLANLFSLPS